MSLTSNSFPLLGAVESLSAAWQAVLQVEFSQAYVQQLHHFLLAQQQATRQVLPALEQRLAALAATPLEQVRIVILGQDPYPTLGHAHGLAFSVLPEVQPLPRSLLNIYKELLTDLGIDNRHSGYLMPWAQQGVLLLNTVLSVEAGQAGSHQKQGWESLTDALIRAVNAQSQPVVFILWGAQAQKKAALVDQARHAVLSSAHPSPLSARHGFFGSKPFSRANAQLQAWGRGEVDWRL